MAIKTRQHTTAGFFMIKRHTTYRKLPKEPPLQHPVTTELAVITCYFNWTGYTKPVQNLHRFLRMMELYNIPVYGVEAVLPGQEKQTLGKPNWQQVEANENQIMFQKERLLNMAERLVPETVNKIAWVDADLGFSNMEWPKETAMLLDYFPFVQPFEMCVWTDEECKEVLRKPSTLRVMGGLPSLSHPGFGMAARRALWREHGGLFDKLIIGNGDMGIATAILGCGLPSTQTYSDDLKAQYFAWHDRVRSMVGHERGAYTRGTVWHEWHGSFKDRNYVNRNKILLRVNPSEHLKTGKNGMLEWTAKTPQDIRDYVKNYFISRKEDG